MTTVGGSDLGVPQALLEEIFQGIIVPDVLMVNAPEPREHPEVVLLGGQPGAGKSTVAQRSLRREFTGRGGLVHVTWDDFRPFHPDYETLLATRPADMPDVTRPAARWWQAQAAQYLRARRINTLLEGGFREPDVVLATAAQFLHDGYEVHVAALAVPAALSRLGIIERYAEQVERVARGRWTTAASHDADYAGTPKVLRLAEASPAVHRISLWTRDGRVFDNRRGADGAWSSPASAVEVLIEARDTPVSSLQRLALTGRLHDTLDHLAHLDAVHLNPALLEMGAAIYADLNADLNGGHNGGHNAPQGQLCMAATAHQQPAPRRPPIWSQAPGGTPLAVSWPQPGRGRESNKEINLEIER